MSSFFGTDCRIVNAHSVATSLAGFHTTEIHGGYRLTVCPPKCFAALYNVNPKTRGNGDAIPVPKCATIASLGALSKALLQNLAPDPAKGAG